MVSRQLSAQFVSCLNLLTDLLTPFTFFIVSWFQLFISKFTVDFMNFKSLWMLWTFTQWSNLLKVDTKFMMALKIKQQPNFTLLSWNLPIGSIYLDPLIVIAVACVGSFLSPGKSSGTWLLLLVLLYSLLKSKYCCVFPGHLAARTDAASCCEKQQFQETCNSLWHFQIENSW